MDRATKKLLLRNCKLDEPVPPGDPRHYDFDHPPLRGQPWRERVAEVIDLSSEPTTQVVTGLPGSGKSTELTQLVQDLTARSYRVVLADAGAWTRDDAPITHQDILLALVLSLYPDGMPESLTGWVKEYAAQVKALLVSDVALSEFGADAGSMRVKAELTTNDTLFQLAARRLGELRDLREKVFRLLATAGASAEKAGEPLVIILDGIEKRATGDLSGPEERENYRNHWFGAFLTHARELQPPVHVVYTVPPFMIRRAAELGALFGQELRFLPMIRVFERTDDQGRPSLHHLGVRAMREALFRRVGAEYFENSTVADWLVVHSGGYMRDLLRLVMDCIYRVNDEGKITRGIADHAIMQVRQTYLEGLDLSDESLLKQVHRDRDFPKDKSTTPQMDALLQGHLMLRYHNSSQWYDVHPLLWDRLEIASPTWETVAEVGP
jgi:hypothetical protein